MTIEQWALKTRYLIGLREAIVLRCSLYKDFSVEAEEEIQRLETEIESLLAMHFSK